MASKDLSGGPTSDAVRANVRRLRDQMELSYAELSRRLEARGHPLAVLALRRIEDGERRVTVDDLSALAVVFGVTPNALLRPPDSRAGDGIATGVQGASHNEVLRWLAGIEPLPSDSPSSRSSLREHVTSEGGHADIDDYYALRAFRVMSGLARFGVGEGPAEVIYKLWDTLRANKHSTVQVLDPDGSEVLSIGLEQLDEAADPDDEAGNLAHELYLVQKRLLDVERRLRLMSTGEREAASRGDN